MAPTGHQAARVGAGLAAVAVSVLVAVSSASTHARFGDLVVALGVVGVGATVVAVAGGWSGVGIAAALSLGSGFAATRFEQPSTVDLRVVLVAPALLLLCELVSWSSDAATSTRPRLARVTGVVLVAGGITAVVAAVATLPVGDDVGLAAAAITAVVVVTLAIVRSARTIASQP